MAICELRGVGRTYGSGPASVHAVRDVDLAVDAGEFTVFVGPSGSGKTTLLNLVGCLDQPTSGEVLVDGRATSGLADADLARLRAERIGFIFQSFNLIPVLTAHENVELAMRLAGARDSAARSREMLKEVGLEGLETRRPNQLSGGQQQRVAIARALARRPALVIADEPTANLDSSNGAQVLDIMRRLNERDGTTFLFSTHDPAVMARARRVVVLKDGRILSDESRETGAAGGDTASGGRP